jgi:hypothetical protein
LVHAINVVIAINVVLAINVITIMKRFLFVHAILKFVARAQFRRVLHFSSVNGIEFMTKVIKEQNTKMFKTHWVMVEKPVFHPENNDPPIFRQNFADFWWNWPKSEERCSKYWGKFNCIDSFTFNFFAQYKIIVVKKHVTFFVCKIREKVHQKVQQPHFESESQKYETVP